MHPQSTADRLPLFYTSLTILLRKMAASMNGVLDETVQEKVKNAKVLVVGAGGIGCELLKNLVLTGFTNIETVGSLILLINYLT